MKSLFASTARGLEELLKNELEGLGAHDCQIVQGGVHFRGDGRLLYQSLMWSRLASRIMLPLGEFKVYSDLDLYLGVQAIDWTTLFGIDKTFAVHFSGTNERSAIPSMAPLRSRMPLLTTLRGVSTRVPAWPSRIPISVSASICSGKRRSYRWISAAMGCISAAIAM